jgi:hypothetical protein
MFLDREDPIPLREAFAELPEPEFDKDLFASAAETVEKV